VVVPDTVPGVRPVVGEVRVAEQAVPPETEKEVERAMQAPATLVGRFPVIPLRQEEGAERE
jgi:hypothetical protein